MASVQCKTMVRFILPWAAVIVFAGKALTARNESRRRWDVSGQVDLAIE
jgi:hypothetical protein